MEWGGAGVAGEGRGVIQVVAPLLPAAATAVGVRGPREEGARVVSLVSELSVLSPWPPPPTSSSSSSSSSSGGSPWPRLLPSSFRIGGALTTPRLMQNHSGRQRKADSSMKWMTWYR
ncbi:hypothetical protein CRUP_002301, partial [Coryphaenoides rupestris]